MKTENVCHCLIRLLALVNQLLMCTASNSVAFKFSSSFVVLFFFFGFLIPLDSPLETKQAITFLLSQNIADWTHDVIISSVGNTYTSNK